MELKVISSSWLINELCIIDNALKLMELFAFLIIHDYWDYGRAPVESTRTDWPRELDTIKQVTFPFLSLILMGRGEEPPLSSGWNLN